MTKALAQHYSSYLKFAIKWRQKCSLVRSPDTAVHEEVGPDAAHVGNQDVPVVGWTGDRQHGTE